MPNNANTNGMRGGHPTMSGESAEERREKQLQEQKRKAAERERRAAAANPKRKAPIDDLLSGKGYTESSELRKKAAARPAVQRGGEKSNKTREMEYEAQIRTIEKALCDKYKIPEPKEIPNTMENGSSNDDTHLTPIGRCLNDRKDPKFWAIKQKDRTYHTWLLGPTGSGKSLPRLTSYLYTPDGKKVAKDIKVGDKVYSRNGNLTTITGVFPQGELDVWEIELDDGRIIECSGEHLWIVTQHNHGVDREYVKTTKELFDSGLTSPGRGWRNRIPLCSPVQYPERNLPIPPYTLGAFLGDGCTVINGTSLWMSAKDTSILDFIEEDLLKHTGTKYKFKKTSENPSNYSYALYQCNEDESLIPPSSLYKYFEELNLICKAHEKFVPTIYLYASIEQRLDILRGLLDTDGSASKGRISFSTTSDALAENVIDIVRSLGYEASRYRDSRQYVNNDHAWEIGIHTQDGANLFRLLRKQRVFDDFRLSRSNVYDAYTRDAPIEFEDAIADEDLPVDPYMYGLYLFSQNTGNQIVMTKLSQHVRSVINKKYPSLISRQLEKRIDPTTALNAFVDGGTYKNGKHINRLLMDVRSVHLDKAQANKKFDERYLHASIAAREEVLRAILDFRCALLNDTGELFCKNDDIRKSIIKLAESLGYSCYEKESGGFKYIKFELSSTSMFSDPAAKEHIAERLSVFDGTRKEKNTSTPIVAIRHTDRKTDMVCFSVSDPTESYLTNDYTVTHNTTLLANMIECDMWQHRGGLLIEPAGDLSETILHSAPPYRIHDTVYLDLLDQTYAPGFNPLEMPVNATDEDRQESVGRVTTLMMRHFGLTGEMPRLTKTLQSALNALAFVPGATILEVMDFYTNEDIQRTVLSFMPEGTMKDEISNRAQNIKLDDLGTLENRISRFTNNRYLKQMFGQSHTTLNWLDLMNKGAMIICPIRKGASADEFFLKFCGSYIVDQVYHASYQRADIPEGKRVIFPVILDEFQNYVSSDIEHMLAECRKYGLAMVLSHQYLSQVKPILGAITNSCLTKIVYAPSALDAPVLAKSFQGISAQDLLSLPKYHVMAVVQQDGGQLQPFMSAIFPPITNTSPCADDVADLILERTHKVYMKPRVQIDKEINERKELLASGDKEAIVAYARRIARGN